MSRYPRNQTPRIPLLPEGGGPAAPGRSAAPPVPTAGGTADELMRAMGLVDLAVDIAARNAARVEHANAKAEQLVRGQAATRVAESAPQWAVLVNEDKLAVPDGVAVDKFARDFVEQRLPEDAPEAYKDEFRSRGVHHVIALLSKRQEERYQETRKGAIDAILNGVSGVSDTGRLDAAVAELRDHWSVEGYDARGKVAQRALGDAAHTGNTAVFNSVKAWAGEDFKDAQIAGQLVLDARLKANANAAKDAAENSLFAAVDSQPYENTLKALAAYRGKEIPQDRADALQQMFLNRAHEQTADAIRTRILDNTVTVDEVDKLVVAGAHRKPTDPNYIDPQAGAAILSMAQTKAKRDVAKDQVRSVLGGGQGLLTESQHGKALGDVLAEEGVISADNRIADPGKLIVAIAQTRVLPESVKQTVLQGLDSTDDNDVRASAVVAGALWKASPTTYTALFNGASPSQQAKLLRAEEGFERGRLQSDATAGQEVQRMRDAAAALPTDPPLPGHMQEQMGNALDPSKKVTAAAKIDTAAAGVLQAARAKLPHTTDTLMSIDWLNPDPGMADADDTVTARIGRWMVEKYTLARTQGSKAEALASAQKYAAAMTERQFDFVRWNDEIVPTLIERGEGVRMPEQYRWGQGFEEEAKADLQKLGVKPDDVRRPVPYLSSERPGWSFVNHDGDPITDDKGNLLVYRPTDRAAESNAKFRQDLDRREAGFQPFDRQRALTEVAMYPYGRPAR